MVNYKEIAKEILEKAGKSEKIKFLGRGSNRITFQHSDAEGVAFKFPKVYFPLFTHAIHDDDYVMMLLEEAYTQMYFEIYTWEECKTSEVAKKFLNPILEWGFVNDTIYTVTPLIKEIACDSDEDLTCMLYNDADYCTFEDIMTNEFGLSDGDLVDNNSNFGLNFDGDIVFVDYGFPSGVTLDRFAQKNFLLDPTIFVEKIENGIDYL